MVGADSGAVGRDKMSEQERLKAFAATVVIVSVVFIVIGIGYMFGAGMAWLTLGSVMLWRAWAVLKSSKDKKVDDGKEH
jgi:hypothetical protein